MTSSRRQGFNRRSTAVQPIWLKDEAVEMASFSFFGPRLRHTVPLVVVLLNESKERGRRDGNQQPDSAFCRDQFLKTEIDNFKKDDSFRC